MDAVAVRTASAASVLAGAMISGLFLTRAVTGLVSASIYAEGRAVEQAERYLAAGPMMDRGAIGIDRTEALWRSGRTRLELWDSLAAADKLGAAGGEALRVATQRFLAGRAATPGSAWFIAALADVYRRREQAARSGRTVDLAALEKGPWSLIGRNGRIAIGLGRAGIAREPNRFELRDQMVFLLLDNGLHEDALRAMEDSARVLPDFGAHPEFVFEALPRDLVETFWRASRSLRPGEAPLLFRERHLYSLGKLGRRLGHLDEAEHDLRAALRTSGTALFHAEDAYHLALVLIDQGRFDDAEGFLVAAAKERVFLPGVAEARARVAQKRERWDDALVQLRSLRSFKPRDVGVMLQFAEAAGKTGAWGQAEEALRWAIVIDPGSAAPRRALVDLFVAQGEKERARRALEEYVDALGRTPDTTRLEQALAAP